MKNDEENTDDLPDPMPAAVRRVRTGGGNHHRAPKFDPTRQSGYFSTLLRSWYTAPPDGLRLSIVGEGLFVMDRNEECLCHPEKLVDFRELSHTIGAPLFVMAYMAWYDLQRGKPKNDRKNFSLNPVLRTDNPQLDTILRNGIAENHFHLVHHQF